MACWQWLQTHVIHKDDSNPCIEDRPQKNEREGVKNNQEMIYSLCRIMVSNDFINRKHFCSSSLNIADVVTASFYMTILIWPYCIYYFFVQGYSSCQEILWHGSGNIARRLHSCHVCPGKIGRFLCNGICTRGKNDVMWLIHNAAFALRS